MITDNMVRQAASTMHVKVRKIGGEWQICPHEAYGTRRQEAATYFTDCNDDAHSTIYAMSKHQ